MKLKIIGTGGGCEAYWAKLPNGMEVLVTDGNDPSLPDAGSETIGVGVYKDEDWQDAVVYKEFSTKDGYSQQVCEKLVEEVIKSISN